MNIRKTIVGTVRFLLALQIILTTAASTLHETSHHENPQHPTREHSEEAIHHSDGHCLFCTFGHTVAESSSEVALVTVLPVTGFTFSVSDHSEEASFTAPAYLRGPPSHS